MPFDVFMPRVDESIAEATILKWHRQVGETIGKDEVLFEIITDGADTMRWIRKIPAPIAGTVLEILLQVNLTAAVGTIVARLGDPSEATAYPLNWQWYYAQNGQQIGPVSEEQLRALISSGSVRQTDLVWMNRLTAWTPAGQVAALLPAPALGPTLVYTPPPAPTSSVSPLNFTFPLESVLTKLREDPYRIGVFGEFSSGKSTFLNALMGEDILSVATEPTTATPTRIQYARVFNVLVYGKPSSPGAGPPIIASLLPLGSEPVWARLMKDGLLGTLQLHHETTSIQRFLERWTKEGQDADKTHEVLIQLPQPFLKGRLALLDTPGVNNEFTKHQGITERVLEEVDLALCLVDARQGGKASEMRFIQSVAGKAAFTQVVVNKIDLIDEEEREELLEAVHNTMQGFWPKERGPCPRPMIASSLASLDPEFRDRFPLLADEFNSLRENLQGLADAQRAGRILARCGNWDQVRIESARKASEEGRYSEAHECLLDVLALYQEAEMEIPEGLLEKIKICEEGMKGATSRINEAHGLLDKAALILLRNDPNDEVRLLLRQAGEIFVQANVRDAAFEKLAMQALGDEAIRYMGRGLNPERLYEEGMACTEENMPESEKQRGVSILKDLAEIGHANSQYQLGKFYYAGKGVFKDFQMAFHWIEQAANQGNMSAQYTLGNLYAQGKGIDQDNFQAASWLQKAANQGHPEAQVNLGINFENGTGGMQRDLSQAMAWYRKAAELGEETAKERLEFVSHELFKESIIHALNEMINENKWLYYDKFFVSPNINEYKLNAAQDRCRAEMGEFVLALIDLTYWGRASNAIIIGEFGIYSHCEGNIIKINYKELPDKQFYVDGSEQLKIRNDANYFKLSEWGVNSDQLLEIINIIISCIRKFK